MIHDIPNDNNRKTCKALKRLEFLHFVIINNCLNTYYVQIREIEHEITL